MPLELALKLLRELISEGLLASDVTIVWHSGEPLTLPPGYYADAIDSITALIEDESPKTSVVFDFQTNATLINKEWCDLFEKYASRIKLGVSCDGPQALNDAFRVDWKGRETFSRTLRGMNALDLRHIEYSVIAVVTRRTLENPDAFFDFFFQRRGHMTDFHFNVLASPQTSSGDLGYCAEDRSSFYQFYRRLWELWQERNTSGDTFPIRNFAQTISRLKRHGVSDKPSYVSQASAPLRSLNMDADGNLTTFYAGLDVTSEAHRYGDGKGLAIGNLHRNTLGETLRSPKLIAMMQDFEASHRRCAASCEYYSVCPGGFELAQISTCDESHPTTPETIECLIHVKTLTDAVLDSLDSSSVLAGGKGL